MLFTTTVSLELSTGHFSVETQVIGKTKILLYGKNIAQTKSMKWKIQHGEEMKEELS